MVHRVSYNVDEPKCHSVVLRKKPLEQGWVQRWFCLVPDDFRPSRIQLIEYVSVLNLIFIINSVFRFGTNTYLHIDVKDINMLS